MPSLSWSRSAGGRGTTLRPRPWKREVVESRANHLPTGTSQSSTRRRPRDRSGCWTPASCRPRSIDPTTSGWRGGVDRHREVAVGIIRPFDRHTMSLAAVHVSEGEIEATACHRRRGGAMAWDRVVQDEPVLVEGHEPGGGRWSGRRSRPRCCGPPRAPPRPGTSAAQRMRGESEARPRIDATSMIGSARRRGG